MATFVLVHGSGHGGWCWRKVVGPLRSAGHEVFTPTLTGLGERSHLLTENVSLTTHIVDLTSLLYYEDLREVILVGHSHAGMVITGVADRAPERVAQVIYFDAIVPRDGESHMDVAPERVAGALNAFRAGWKLVWPRPDAGKMFGVTDPVDLQWMDERLTPQPIRTATDRLHLGDPARQSRVLRSYIACQRPEQSGGSDGDRLDEFRSSGRFRQLDTGHDAMITAPAETVAVLCELAQG